MMSGTIALYMPAQIPWQMRSKIRAYILANSIRQPMTTAAALITSKEDLNEDMVTSERDG